MKEWLSLQRSGLKRCSVNVGWSQAGGHCCSALGRRHWKCSGEAPQLLTQRGTKLYLGIHQNQDWGSSKVAQRVGVFAAKPEKLSLTRRSTWQEKRTSS